MPMVIQPFGRCLSPSVLRTTEISLLGYSLTAFRGCSEEQCCGKKRLHNHYKVCMLLIIVSKEIYKKFNEENMSSSPSLNLFLVEVYLVTSFIQLHYQAPTRNRNCQLLRCIGRQKHTEGPALTEQVFSEAGHNPSIHAFPAKYVNVYMDE